MHHLRSSEAKSNYAFMQEKHEKHFFVLLCPENNEKFPSLDLENFSLSGKFFFARSGEFPQHSEFLPIDEKYRAVKDGFTQFVADNVGRNTGALNALG